MIKRLAIAFFYDESGVIDDYFSHLISSLKPFVDHTVVVSNGQLTQNSERKIRPLVEDLIIRENIGYDVWAYKSALEQVGWDRLGEYDEILLYNHTFYGPIFPFSEMFSTMEKRNCDFWGISAHRSMTPNFFDSKQPELPFHLNSHFIAVRRKMFLSSNFRTYWTDMGEVRSYKDSVVMHETRFTKWFQDLGYTCSVYVDPEDYNSPYPVFMEIDKTLENRSPILKKRLFFHDTIFLDAEGIDLPRALSIIEKDSDYDLNLIWKSIGRIAQPRTLNNNAALLSVFPNVVESSQTQISELKIAVCAHVYYTDMLEEILSYTRNISYGYDLIITTDTAEKKLEIEKLIDGESGTKNTFVLLSASNDGRDTSSLLITCREFFLDDRYDFVCRIHTKKSPQDGTRGEMFKRHMFENLLGGHGYVSNLLDFLNRNENIGLAFPPLIHIGYPTMGHSWFTNKDNVSNLVTKLDLKVPLDENTPVCPNGGMYWFRPRALRKLFAHAWTWDDFSSKTYSDGSLPHAIERLIGYVAIDAGYNVRHVLTTKQAAHNYVMLEAKLQALLSRIPSADIRLQLNFLENRSIRGNDRVSESAVHLLQSIKRSLLYRSPVLFGILKPVYRFLRGISKQRRTT